MTGALLGLALGSGLACVWWSFWPDAPRETPSVPPRVWSRWCDDVVAARLHRVGPVAVLLGAGALGLVITTLGMALTRVPAVSLAFGAMAVVLPVSLVRARARRRRSLQRQVWPDVVDHVASAVRAGLALPEALVQLGDRGPLELRDQFTAFAHDYRATGLFSDSLDRLKDRLADPVADRLIEALRLAREVGGSDLGRVLRALSTFLREDARSRAELEARQSWTVNAARLAMAAPWVVLLLMATRGEALQAYRAPQGVLVLLVGAALSCLAYVVMLRIGRLPEEQRVLR